MTFPTQLTDYLQPSVDKFTFTTNEALDSTEVEVTITGGVAAFEVPCVINIEGELIKAEGKDGAKTVSVNAGGTGYVQDEDLTITTFGGNATLNIDTVSGGVVTAVSILTKGSDYEVSTGNATSGGSGSGCTIDVDSITTDELTVCTRGFGGTTATTHVTSTTGYIPFTAEHYIEMTDGTDAVDTYFCRTVSSLPASGTEYEMVEYSNEVYIWNGSSWERIGMVINHDNLKDLDSGDPHPVYYTASEMTTAHTALEADHVTDGDTHDHIDGVGFAAFDNNIDRTLATPSDGEIVLVTKAGVQTASVNAGGTGYSVNDTLTITPSGDDNCTLTVASLSGSAVATVTLTGRGSGYSVSTGNATTVEPSGGTGCTIDIDTITVSGTLYTGESSTWSEVVGAPSGLIMAFDPVNLSGACPDGWSRYTTLDSQYVKGTSGATQGTGGSNTHTHTFDSTDVVTHSHTIDAQDVNATNNPSHTHSTNRGSSGASTGYHGARNSSSSSVTTTSSGGHGHTGTMQNDSESTGEASPETDSANGEPLYKLVVWCEKD